MFQKGVSGNPAGRPKGASNIDRINHLDLQIWFKKLFEDVELVDDPEKRIQFEMQIADKLLAKVANLPSSPEQSADNAKARQEMMGALENSVKAPEGEEDAGLIG